MTRHTYMFRFHKDDSSIALLAARKWQLDGFYNRGIYLMIADEIKTAAAESPCEKVSLWVSVIPPGGTEGEE